MSQNLNLLRQKYCRPATFTCKRTDHLFPLEEECEQGKALLAKAPKTLLDLQEFDPYGLQQTYRDEATGAELTGLRRLRPRRKPPISFRNRYGFAPHNQPA